MAELTAKEIEEIYYHVEAMINAHVKELMQISADGEMTINTDVKRDTDGEIFGVAFVYAIDPTQATPEQFAEMKQLKEALDKASDIIKER